jgi:hypothetical protein
MELEDSSEISESNQPPFLELQLFEWQHNNPWEACNQHSAGAALDDNLQLTQEQLSS